MHSQVYHLNWQQTWYFLPSSKIFCLSPSYSFNFWLFPAPSQASHQAIIHLLYSSSSSSQTSHSPFLLLPPPLPVKSQQCAASLWAGETLRQHTQESLQKQTFFAISFFLDCGCKTFFFFPVFPLRVNFFVSCIFFIKDYNAPLLPPNFFWWVLFNSCASAGPEEPVFINGSCDDSYLPFPLLIFLFSPFLFLSSKSPSKPASSNCQAHATLNLTPADICQMQDLRAGLCTKMVLNKCNFTFFFFLICFGMHVCDELLLLLCSYCWC